MAAAPGASGSPVILSSSGVAGWKWSPARAVDASKLDRTRRTAIKNRDRETLGRRDTTNLRTDFSLCQNVVVLRTNWQQAPTNAFLVAPWYKTIGRLGPPRMCAGSQQVSDRRHRLAG